MPTRTKLIRILIVTGLILSIPLIAMQFTEEVDWGFPDFVLMGLLIAGTGFAYELAALRIRTPLYRALAGLGLLTLLLLIWVELAVGIF